MLHLEAGVGHELFEEGLELSVSLLAENTLGSDVGENVSGLRSYQSKIEFFELCDFGSLQLVKEASDTSVQNANLFLGWNWHVLLLLEQFSKLFSSVK